VFIELLSHEGLLTFYYKRELDLGAVMINAKVGAVALKMALSGTDSDMTKFWLKSRAGWKETSVVEKTVVNQRRFHCTCETPGSMSCYDRKWYK